MALYWPAFYGIAATGYMGRHSIIQHFWACVDWLTMQECLWWHWYTLAFCMQYDNWSMYKVYNKVSNQCGESVQMVAYWKIFGQCVLLTAQCTFITHALSNNFLSMFYVSWWNWYLYRIRGAMHCDNIDQWCFYSVDPYQTSTSIIQW